MLKSLAMPARCCEVQQADSTVAVRNRMWCTVSPTSYQLHLTVSQLVKKFPAFYGTPSFITVNLTFISPCIIVIDEEWKTNLMSLAILFHFLRAQHVSDINISIIRSLRLCWWITTSVVLFSVRCVLELLVRLVLSGVRFAGWSLWWFINTVASSWRWIY